MKLADPNEISLLNKYEGTCMRGLTNKAGPALFLVGSDRRRFIYPC